MVKSSLNFYTKNVYITHIQVFSTLVILVGKVIIKWLLNNLDAKKYDYLYGNKSCFICQSFIEEF